MAAVSSEAPRTAILRVRMFIQKGLGNRANNPGDHVEYAFDEETGRAHLTLFGRAFAYTSAERYEPEAKEGVYRAALCRGILVTMLDQIPKERKEKFKLAEVAIEWQSMATLGPLPLRFSELSDTHASNGTVPATPPPRALPTEAPRHGLNSLVQNAPTKATLPAPPTAPAVERVAASVSSSESKQAPIMPPARPLPTGPAKTLAGNSLSRPAASTVDPSTGSSSRAVNNMPSQAKAPGSAKANDVEAWTTFVAAATPTLALPRLRWFCEMHLGRVKKPQVYLPYFTFKVDARKHVADVAIASKTAFVHLDLTDNDIKVIQNTRAGPAWIEEELAREAIRKGIFARFMKNRMPPASISSKVRQVVDRYADLSSLSPNPRPPLPSQPPPRTAQPPPGAPTAFADPASTRTVPPPGPLRSSVWAPPKPSATLPAALALSATSSPILAAPRISATVPPPPPPTALSENLGSTSALSQSQGGQTASLPATRATSTLLPLQPPHSSASLLTGRSDQGTLPHAIPSGPSRDPRLQARLASLKSAHTAQESTPVASPPANTASSADAIPASVRVVDSAMIGQASPSVGGSQTSVPTSSKFGIPLPFKTKSHTPPTSRLSEDLPSPIAAQEAFPTAKTVPVLSNHILQDRKGRNEAHIPPYQQPSPVRAGSADHDPATELPVAHTLGKHHISEGLPMVEPQTEPVTLSQRLTPEGTTRERRTSTHADATLLSRLVDPAAEDDLVAQHPYSLDNRPHAAATSAENGDTPSLFERLEDREAELRNAIARTGVLKRLPSRDMTAVLASGPEVNENKKQENRQNMQTSDAMIVDSDQSIVEVHVSGKIPHTEASLEAASSAPNSLPLSPRAPPQASVQTTADVHEANSSRVAPACLTQGSKLPLPQAMVVETSQPTNSQRNGSVPPGIMTSEAVSGKAISPEQATEIARLMNSIHSDKAAQDSRSRERTRTESTMSYKSVENANRSKDSASQADVALEQQKKRRRESDAGRTVSETLRPKETEEGHGKRRRRSSPPPSASSSARMHAPGGGRGDGANATAMYADVEKMTAILAKMANNSLSYDQACEALYALHLPASLDGAAFDALDAIWSSSPAQLLQQANISDAGSELVLMPKSWVQESLELLQEQSSAQTT